MDEKKTPVPLNYASPPAKRSFEEAFIEFIEQEIADGHLRPNTGRVRFVVLVVFWTIIAGLLLLLIAAIV